MNLAQLRAFDMVVRTGSFTAAARALHVSQPAITNHIRALEDYYGVDLFRRRGRGVEPNELGRTLAEVSRQLFTLEEQATDLLQASKALRWGTLRVAADGPYILIPLVAAFRERFPGVRVGLTISNTSGVQDALVHERCDVGIHAHLDEDDRMYVKPLSTYRVIIFVSTVHPWAQAKRRSVPVAELDGAPVILRERGSSTRRLFERACQKARVRPDYVIETTSRETVKEAVAAGLGIGVISEAELRDDPRFWRVMVDGADLEYTECVVCLDRKKNLRLLSEFFGLVDSLGETVTP
ncbi:MAG: LysR substrate-binding domain-containing protein [Gammaproteobacteria bacterium]|nr:LysR substrate-binding domain-containing protein [Gammaproteobacteria bacterium]